MSSPATPVPASSSAARAPPTTMSATITSELTSPAAMPSPMFHTASISTTSPATPLAARPARATSSPETAGRAWISPARMPRETEFNGNFIGTDSVGATDVPNQGDGVLIDGAPGNIIGDIELGQNNVISGNTGDGVDITGSDAKNNVIQHNFIGTDVTATIKIGNQEYGVEVRNGGSNNTIGGNATAYANTIAFNGAAFAARGFGVECPGRPAKRHPRKFHFPECRPRHRSGEPQQSRHLHHQHVSGRQQSHRSGAGRPGRYLCGHRGLPHLHHLDPQQHPEYHLHHRLLRQYRARSLRLRRRANIPDLRHLHHRRQRQRQFQPSLPFHRFSSFPPRPPTRKATPPSSRWWTAMPTDLPMRGRRAASTSTKTAPSI